MPTEMPREAVRQQASNCRWVVLTASFFSFVAYAIVFQLVPPLLGGLQAEFGVNDAQAGLLMSMAVVPGIILALPAGLFMNRYGFRSLGFLSTVSVAVGSLTTALANDFLTALLGRFILGVGGTFLIVGSPTIIPQWFSHRELGKAMGIYGTNMPLAIIIAFPTATVLSQNFGWRCPFYVGGAVSLVAALVFVVTVREGPLKGEPRPMKLSDFKRAVGSSEVWKASLIWLFFETTTIGFLTWAPRLFERFKGLEPLYASLLASVVMYSAVFFVPLFGWASDKVGRRRPFIVAGSISMALTLISIAYANDVGLFFSVFALGISAAAIPPLAMAVVAESLPPRLSGTGFGIVTLCQNVGITLSAPLAGYFLQTTQSLLLTFLGLSLFALAGAITGLTIRTR
ncbi:hypothetical protein COS86_03335 [Candidatus Bathyarchaeota archaeon CG07_land_8_20_14_0_80_47_9]|nr:MAG: hypothetical protein COS86_03335 [Candidatus Bathyarchaeota archaeon CG07_land_8_20_14_0_80_47_9]